MARLFKLESTHDRVRSDCVIGEYNEPPIIGKSFMIVGPPIVNGATARIVTTSIVQDVLPHEDGAYTFHTQNSTYMLQPNEEATHQ